MCAADPGDPKARDFAHPTALPSSDAVSRAWQDANRRWWESHPMRYDWRASIAAAEYTDGWFREIDRRFFESARAYMPWTHTPFDALIPFADLRDKTVLEIGVGMGSHAQLLAGAAKRFVGIDLTQYATTATRRRLDAFRAPGLICRMDGECLGLRDASVDFVWSWGVIHHSSDTRRVLREIQRVLHPGGTAVIMVYHRSPWLWWLVTFGLLGLMRGRLFRTGSLNRILQESTDGALARYYTPGEWRALAGEFFDVQKVMIYGQAGDLVALPAGRIKEAILAALPHRVVRFFCNRLKIGSFLVSVLRRRADDRNGTPAHATAPSSSRTSAMRPR